MTERGRREVSRAGFDNRDRDRVLWVNVVLQAIMDATEIKNSGAANLDQRRARAWFNLSNPDFVKVCHLAHLDPEATYQKARRAIERYDLAVANGEKPSVQRDEKPEPKRIGPAPKQHVIDGVSLTLAEWAAHAGITYRTLFQRMRGGRTLAEAIAMPKGRQPNRGVVFNFEGLKGTGAGSTAQEIPEITFSAEATTE